jgi:hypothetical protein
MRFEILIFILISTVTSTVSFIYYILNYYGVKSLKIKDKDRHENMNYSMNDVTAIVPVRSESAILFSNSVESLRWQVGRVIVVGDGVSEPYREICTQKGIEFISLSERSGKRVAMAEGMKHVKTAVTLFMDSDAVISSDAVMRVLRMFRSNIGGVGGNIHMNTDDENPYSYAGEFFERSKETVQKTMMAFGSVMLIDAAFAAYRTDIIRDYVLSDEFRNYRVHGEIPYYGGGDDAELTSYVIRNGYVAAKAFDANVVVESKKNFHSMTKQYIRWSRTSWRTFFRNFRNGTFRKANKFYKVEQILTYLLPVLFLSVIIFKSAFLLLVISKFGFDPLIIARRFIYMPGSRLFHLSTFISMLSSLSSVFFLSTIFSRDTKKKLKLFIYGVSGTFLLFLTTIVGLFTFNRN